MEQILYDRPREKIRNRGVRSLSIVELLQAIVSSGTSKLSSARIARSIARHLEPGSPVLTFDTLIKLDGLGEAKACQLLAGIELGRRLAAVTVVAATGEGDISDGLAGQPSSTGKGIASTSSNKLLKAFASLGRVSKRSAIYASLDGSGEVIKIHTKVIPASEHPSLLIRSIFSQILADGAAGVLVVIGYKGQSLEPTIHELQLAKQASNTSKLLQIKLASFSLINASGRYDIKRVNYE